jgi:hypothetical protein
MMTNYETIKPVITFGYAVSAIGFLGVVFLPGFIYHTINHQTMWLMIFGAFQAILFFIAGIGIVTRRYWGYYLLKLTLYVFVLWFPVFTFAALKGLKYVKENNIKDYFMRNVIEL